MASCSRKSLLRVIGNAGFTFAEIIVSVSILGLLSAGSIWGLAQANNYASVARLYTGAETVAQNRIDEILSESPFNPQDNEIPAVLALGTHAAETVQVYNEPNPVGGTQRIITGQLVTTVSQVVAPGFPNLNMYAATVVVTYTFRGKNYRVQFNAMRASDV
jgi:prepilin-type N-terminal cleavage/methylation domain-containing protein